MKSFRPLLIFAVSTQSLVQGNLRGNDISNRSLESIRRLEQENILKTYKEEVMKFAFPDTSDVSVNTMFGTAGISFDLERILPSEKIIVHSPDEP